MKTVSITNQLARQLYPEAAPEFKTELEKAFGKAFFSQKITDRIKSMKDVYEVLGLDEADCTPYAKPVNDRQEAVNAFEQAVLAVQALNEGWTPDWDNEDEPKYEIWWDMECGFSLFSVYGIYQSSDVGSRLCFRSRELAEWVGKQNWLVNIFKKFMR